MKHTIELDDLELTALLTHLEGQNEIMNESDEEKCDYENSTSTNEIAAKIIQNLFRIKRNYKREMAARVIQTIVIDKINRKMERMLMIIDSRNRRTKN